MQTTEDLFKEAVDRYQKGESAKTLIPVFKDICDRASKNSPAWTSLAWLYLLDDKPEAAYKAARKAIKLSPEDAQARINLAIAMLDSGKKGVREQVDSASQLIMVSEELRQEAETNFEEGLQRKPDWKSLQRVRDWLFSA